MVLENFILFIQSGKCNGSGVKGRGKPVVRTRPGPNAFQGATKAGTTNQTKSNVHHATMIMQQQAPVTNNNNNNKVLITTNVPVVTSAQPPGSPMSSDKQNFGQQNKTVMQSSQQQQSQARGLQCKPAPMQPQYQQMFMQQMQQLQHQQQIQQQCQQQQTQSAQQQIQPKPLMGTFISAPTTTLPCHSLNTRFSLRMEILYTYIPSRVSWNRISILHDTPTRYQTN